jgi:beta-lactam-binding protein with PASTA domain
VWLPDAPGLPPYTHKVTSLDDLVGTVVDGRYRIDAKLARGGMATVYRATDLRLDRVVALKVMHPHLATDPDFVQRFEREARSAARLHHPHVVGVFDQGTDGERVYLAMEFVEGRTLRDVMREYGPLTPEQALVIVDPILKALQAAHDAGFVHRDIKPENILIADDGRVKVADFGLARAFASSDASATTGVIMGTVAYLAPEQVERGEADRRTDIYATGIVLFEMITNHVPHEGESPIAVAFAHVHEDVPPPSQVNPSVPAGIDELVVRATRRDANRRFADADAFRVAANSLRDTLPKPRPFADGSADMALSDTVVVPAEEFAAPRAEPRERRRRTGLWAALIVAIAVGVAGFAGWYLAAGPGQRVAMPDVLGTPVDAATAQLAAVDLTLTVAGRDFSEEIPADAVISTDPAPGDGARIGGAVSAIVSLGPERTDVPDVAGLGVEEAEAALAAANLALGERDAVFDTKVPEGAVVATAPQAGSEVRPGTPVTLQLSKGPAPVPIPNIVGARVNAARGALGDVDLRAKVTERFSESVAKGRVIRVKPKVGAIVPAGGQVEVVVSKGPPPVTVPNLVDMPRARAVSTLRGLGLRVNVDAGSLVRLNRVFDQSPSAGSKVPRGSRVTIRVI